MPDMRCFWAIIAFVTVLFKAQAASPAFVEIPFQYREGLLWIEVHIPQSDKPLNFLVDTGAGASVINLSTAKQLGLKPGRTVAARGVGVKLTGYWQQGIIAKAGDIDLPANYLALDLERFSQSCERPMDGLLGADFFREHIVQIDFEAHKVRLLRREARQSSDEILPLETRCCGMRVPITVNNRKHQWVRLDTGCASALQWVTSSVDPAHCAHQTAIGLTELSIAQTKTAVDIGEQRFENVPTGLHETAIFPGEAGLLGNGLLSRFSAVTIDARAGRVILEGRHPAAQ